MYCCHLEEGIFRVTPTLFNLHMLSCDNWRMNTEGGFCTGATLNHFNVHLQHRNTQLSVRGSLCGWSELLLMCFLSLAQTPLQTGPRSIGCLPRIQTRWGSWTDCVTLFAGTTALLDDLCHRGCSWWWLWCSPPLSEEDFDGHHPPDLCTVWMKLLMSNRWGEMACI